MENNDYPIKYAIKKIVEQGITKAYIVMKCYLLNDSYVIPGTNTKTNQIVYCYGYKYIKQEPLYIEGLCYNDDFTDYVFDNLDEAIRYSRALNKTKILNQNNYSFEKYYNIEYNLLNDKEINNNIIDFNKAKKRRRNKYE